jgi:hypothetical protein
MAHYLVSGTPVNPSALAELETRLAAQEFVTLEPFGRELSDALRNARRQADGTAIWEEEDYCRPPLAQERAAVLDHYFAELRTEPVVEGAGWARIRAMPALFPALAAR